MLISEIYCLASESIVLFSFLITFGGELRINNIYIIRLRMGNSSSNDSSNPFYASEGGKDSELTQLLQEFTFVSVYEDELFNRCSVIEHK